MTRMKLLEGITYRGMFIPGGAVVDFDDRKIEWLVAHKIAESAEIAFPDGRPALPIAERAAATPMDQAVGDEESVDAGLDSERILVALATRLAVIQTANGYNTNAGLHVFRGRKSFDFDDATQFPALTIFDEEETTKAGHEERYDNEFMVYIEGHIAAGATHPADPAHDLLADCKKAALLVNDQTLGHLASGMEYAGRSIEFPDDAGKVITIRMALKVTYPEMFGDPYTVI